MNKTRIRLRVWIPDPGSGGSVDEDRLVNIEIKLAHQEDVLAALNEALTSQQAQITRLETLIDSLIERVRVLSEARAAQDGDERPPHY
ncbi:MAG: SlyX family protein [Woeseiaceae bacterium]|nr:SlyX family protein [Woeseiaceae bacterium]